MQTRLQQLVSLKIGEIIGNQLGKVIQTADGFKTLQARLKLVSDTTDEYNVAQKEVFNIAQRTRASLEGTANVYGKLETSVKQLGGTQQDALQVTETLNQAIALTSQGAAQDEAAILQFSQALGSGVLRGDEFNSVMENSPGLAKALADGLQVPITALRGMAEAGELTADRLINALGKAAPSVAKQFSQLPVTVGQAFTQLNNEFTRYIGEADAAGGATAKLAASIQFVAENLKPLAETALTLAAVYGATLLQGLLKSSAAMVDSVAASRAKMLAERELLAGEIMLAQHQAQLAASTLNAAKANMDMALSQKKAATGFFETAIAANNAKLAIQGYYTASTAAAEKQAALAALTTKAADAMTLAQRAAAGLNAALNLFISFEIGKTVGEWLNQFDLVKAAGVRLAEVLTIVKTGAEGMFNGVSFGDRIEQIKNIHAEYNELAASIGKATIEQNNNTDAGKATASQMQIQTNNAEKLAKTYRALADVAEFKTKSQLQVIDDNKDAAVGKVQTSITDAGGVDRSRQRESEITRISIQADQERSKVLADSTKKRIDLIDQAYKAEIASAAKSKKDVSELNQKWLADKQKVLSEWVDASRKSIAELTALEQKHAETATQLRNSVAENQQSRREKIAGLKGETNITQASDLYRLRNTLGESDLQSKLQAAQKSGDLSGQLDAAKRLEAVYEKVADAAKSAFDAGNIDGGQLRAAIYNLESAGKQADQLALKAANDEQAQSEKLKVSLEERKVTLLEAKKLLDDLVTTAQQGMTLVVDSSQVDAALAKINEIPDQKTISLNVDAGGSSAPTAPGYADGVRLPGFGGGDRRPALLEDGEGVVNKHGLRALDAAFGPGFFDGINAGASPVELLRRHVGTMRLADGGRIAINMPSIDLPNIAGKSGSPINIHLPDGSKYGPFTGSGDSSAALEAALQREVLRRGRRG
jgi:tape measure domain-containing protein